MNAARKYVEAALFVALWMGLGWIFRLDANSYLVLGVPLLVAFQLGIRRRPLPTLWVREPASSFRLDGLGAFFAGLLVLVPALDLWQWARAHGNWVVGAWLFCALVGAVLAALALRRQSPSAARRALPAFLSAVAIGVALMAVASLLRGHSISVPLVKLWPLLHQFLSYFAVSFVIEEVVFRGALDTHVCPPPSGSRSTWWSAIYVSMLWGIWHLPLIPTKNALELIAVIPIILLVHTFVGVPLSFAWRTGGTLVLPAFAHALIDAYRNVIQ